MEDEIESRMETELSLLESMYPEQVQYHKKAREVRYRSETGGFSLRLPAHYLESELPDVLSANAGRIDLREQLKLRVRNLAVGEEVLDSVILAFDELAEASEPQEPENADGDVTSGEDDRKKATIIVWLHHLLNTNKRKLALSPPLGVSGVTKPGYPGVLIYSGPAKAVHEHVNELKQQNWQAFQVRLESEDEWTFSHGTGVHEKEAMKEVVAAIGEAHKETFLGAMRIK